MISNDGRFAAVMPDPDEGGFAVIDTETGEAVIRSDPENVPNFTNVYYLSEGVLVVSYLSREQITYFYRPSDQRLFKMALPNGLSFVDVVDDDDDDGNGEHESSEQRRRRRGVYLGAAAGAVGQ